MSEANGERSTRQSENECAFSRDRYDAVLLDLDGVITDTASVHAACWKQMFDEYLQKRATQKGEVFHPFDSAADYRLYVDGKPRFDGVRDFLTSRGIQLPEGWGTARTSWSIRSLKREGSSPTREALNSFISSAVAGSKSPSSPQVRTARPF